MPGFRHNLVRLVFRAATLVVFLLPGATALAHNGPPFPIITDKQVGPCVVSLWTHPDIGTGTFFVIASPNQQQSCPQDTSFQVAVQPATGRLAEKRYNTWRDAVRGQTQYKTEVAFDAQELWNVRLIVNSSRGNGEAMATVTPTPPGLGRWDLLFYASPFLLVAVLWIRAMSRRKTARRKTSSGEMSRIQGSTS
jgi:hypothetical protein